jgi:tetratricopeptide (TPR) repeat protein
MVNRKHLGKRMAHAAQSRGLHYALAVLPILAASAPVMGDTSGLLDPHEVINQISPAVQSSTATKPSDAALLAADIAKFRISSEELSPQVAATAWFRLLDRAISEGSHPNPADVASFDVPLGRPVGVVSAVAALPPPEAWRSLEADSNKRTPHSLDGYRALSVRLLPAVLLGDHLATKSILASVDSAVSSLPPEQRIIPNSRITSIRRLLITLYGTPSEVAAQFREDVTDAASGSSAVSRYTAEVQVPDLVTLIGEAEATAILQGVITQPISLRVESGDGTAALARRIALENVDALKIPQWALANSIDSAPLYEALTRKFGAEPPKDTADSASSQFGDSAREEADTYYMLFLITNHRGPEAEKLLASMAGGTALEIPRGAILALQKAHQNEALYEFLQGSLSRNPRLQVWDVYIQQAAYTGNSQAALSTVDAALKRTDLPAYLRADLGRRRADALLALNETDAGLKALQSLLLQPPTSSDPYLVERTNAALRLASLGRVLNRPDLADKGLQFVQSALALPSQSGGRGLDRLTVLRAFFAEGRKQQKPREVQSAAITELKRHDSNTEPGAEQAEMMGVPGSRPLHQAALIELVSLYVAANRPQDARILLDDADGWGGRDVRDLLTAVDSQGVPFAVSAAKALSATDDIPSAVRILTATIAQFPGHDAAYELEATIDPGAAGVFDAQYKTDQFEERPLIWNATLLARRKEYDAAEKTVRAAIAIDPSDGEEGVNDRMRAYSVLADILEAKGDSKGAAETREIVTAIRISERTDELYALGLYQRAFAGYRTALEHFSDAYCIQSRLAVQLTKQGQHEQAAEHYRRAYELMPSSFGRVESHCFGCESVFDGVQQQTIAEQVFHTLEKKDPGNAQVHYLQGYLLQEEGRYAEALPEFRKAVQIDGNYLNAWRQLNKLSGHIYLPSVDRDVVTIKLIELDPQQRHVTYDVSAVGDFPALWHAVAQVDRSRKGSLPNRGPLYSLKQSARTYDQKQAELPPALRSQIQQYQLLFAGRQIGHELPSPPLTLGKHVLLMNIAGLIGSAGGGPEFGDEVD